MFRCCLMPRWNPSQSTCKQEPSTCYDNSKVSWKARRRRKRYDVFRVAMVAGCFVIQPTIIIIILLLYLMLNDSTETAHAAFNSPTVLIRHACCRLQRKRKVNRLVRTHQSWASRRAQTWSRKSSLRIPTALMKTVRQRRKRYCLRFTSCFVMSCCIV